MSKRDKFWVLRDGSKQNPAVPHYWEEIDLGGGITEAPVDNFKYVRRNGQWEHLSIQQVVWKGIDDPNTLPDFGSAGDKYFMEEHLIPGSDYVIQTVDGFHNSFEFSDDGNPNTGYVSSGVSDTSYIGFYPQWDNGTTIDPEKIYVTFKNNPSPSDSISFNGISISVSSGIINPSNPLQYSWTPSEDPNVTTIVNNIVGAGNYKVLVHTSQGSTTIPRKEFIKQSDGSWESINIEILKDIPIDKLLENATYNISYVDNNNFTKTFNKFSFLEAGYTAQVQITNNPITNGTDTQTTYRDSSGNIKIETLESRDSAGRITSFDRR